jgi:hypothetical protein
MRDSRFHGKAFKKALIPCQEYENKRGKWKQTVKKKNKERRREKQSV